MALGYVGVGVAREDDLTLFRKFQGRQPCARWPGQDGCSRRPATTPDSPSSAVEDRRFRSCTANSTNDRFLGSVGVPQRSQITAVLVAVRVTDHHLLPVGAGRKRSAIWPGDE